MYKLLPVLLAGVLFTACSSDKKEQLLLQSFYKHQQYYTHLQRTEVVWIETEKSEKPFIATYLNKRSKKLGKEIFIVSVVKEEGISSKDLLSSYHLHLDKELPQEVVLLTHTHMLLKHIPLVQEWNDYFMVSFSENTKRNFNLSLFIEKHKTDTLHFSKVAKYTLETNTEE